MQNSTATLEDRVSVSYKTKPKQKETKPNLTIWTSNHTPWHLPKWTEKLCPHKTQHMDGYSFVLNCQKLGASKMPFRWMDKQWYGYITMECD